MSCECKILQTRGHCQTTPDRFTLTKGKKTQSITNFMCKHQRSCSSRYYNPAVWHCHRGNQAEIVGLFGACGNYVCFFSFLWTTPTQSLHYSATATPGARLHTSITEVTILPLAAVGSTAALICIWIFKNVSRQVQTCFRVCGNHAIVL